MSADSTRPFYDAIILAGGAGRRLGGADKALVVIGAGTLLERALAAVGDAAQVIVVGPSRAINAAVLFTQEDPPGGGPAAAIAHAVQFVTADVAVVLAVDVPFAAAAIPRLVAALPGHEAAMVLDRAGARQPLIAAYRSDALKARADEATWVDAAVRSLVEPFDVVEVPAVADEALDCDTPDDVDRAQALADPQLGNGCSGVESL